MSKPTNNTRHEQDLEILRGVGNRQTVIEGGIDYAPPELESPEPPTVRPVPATPKQDKK